MNNVSSGSGNTGQYTSIGIPDRKERQAQYSSAGKDGAA